MPLPEDPEKYVICSQLLSEGRYKESLTLAESIVSPIYRSAIFIDAGLATGKSSKIREGIKLIEDSLASDQVTHQFTKASLLYNIANGYSSLYKLKRQNKKKTIPTNDEELRTAKKFYREALASIDNVDGAFASQVLVNLGNCLSQFGRYIEAIEYYQLALDAEPENGMAAGNLAVELEHVSWLTGHYRHEYIALAYKLVSDSLGPNMHLHYGSLVAKQGFQSVYKRLQSFVEYHSEPLLPPQPHTIEESDNEQKRYLQFCLNKGLFLNPWVGNGNLSPGITDNISFGPIVT